ncbi:metalloendopeptidase [Candidatus Scalindua japonica]|uniref:Metalloendopeptidase n=1 Tax=Candidatus Scalindua japonica TaxID=1284222 RepID=A0A286U1K0_9BACT|nr:peptidoglycan DD-metalloendopeptidase family protein [Candidatus Scalindua japonica]GAX62004.1 metalloendopeptidase [Candidatus Scalindua japonica]
MKSKENKIPESTFATSFLRHNNGFHIYEFKEWVFYPGMLFQDTEAWWKNNGLRPAPHEGIDFCYYRDKTGQVRHVGNGTKIPVMYTGDIVYIHDDFLGKSIYIKHSFKDKSGKTLHTVYGHTKPGNNQDLGKRVYEGDIIAEVAATSENSRIHPHIHITMAWIPESLPCNQLNWESIGNSRYITLCNPLKYI